MTTKLSSVLPTIILKWIKREQRGEDSAKEHVELPVYLNQARKTGRLDQESKLALKTD